SFLSWMPREDVIKYMHESDCFVMPSYNETFGIVYVEAMASGCYTIGSRGEGIDGIITDGHNGALVESGSVSSLTEALEHYFRLTPEELLPILERAIDETQSEMDAALELLDFACSKKAPDIYNF
ncbi:MAG: glycosyltransferase, partial [Ruminococcaceae bacterium]|nr:glycosyltransferase [Oscillospiraceae bacterium]